MCITDKLLAGSISSFIYDRERVLVILTDWLRGVWLRGSALGLDREFR